MSTIGAFISSVYHTHPTLTYVPTNFGQYPSNFDLRTDKLQKLCIQLRPTDLLTSNNTRTTLTYVPMKFRQYKKYSNLPTYEIWRFGRFAWFGPIKQLGPMNIGDLEISNDLDPLNNLDTQTLTIWTVWTIWTYKLWRFGPLKYFDLFERFKLII